VPKTHVQDEHYVMFWQKSDFFPVRMHMCYATQLKYS
jgi:hypothetical protein